MTQPNEAEIAAILGTLRRTGGEPSNVEAKSGRGGFPQSVRETLVAFANSDGGRVLIGVDESNGFGVVDNPNIAQYRDQLADMARDAIVPALQIPMHFVEVEGATILVADVSPATADQRPVYVRTKGVGTGSYIRAGDGDRRMTDAEIALVYSLRSQPSYDRQPVTEAMMDDLNMTAVRRMLERARVGSPSLRDADEEVALTRVNVISRTEAGIRPTLAGLLAFGKFPQQFFPQLMVTVIVHPSSSPSGSQERIRFLDNVTVRGSIPEMVSEAMSSLQRNLNARAEVEGAGRTDHLDYPMDSIREALVNALLHRDYSEVTQGTQVQVELHPDRLLIRSPGGLYGPITEDDLGTEGISSSRNAVLATLLSDTYLPQSDQLVAENRASGIPTMISRARQRGLERPVFESTITSFKVTMSRSQLLGPAVRRWLADLRVDLPSPAHEIAMAMMRTGYATNEGLREWGIDRIEAGQVFRHLVDQGLAVRENGRRYAHYLLDPSIRQGAAALNRETQPQFTVDMVRQDERQSVADHVRTAGSATAAEVAAAIGISRGTAVNRLNKLVRMGLVHATEATRSPKRRYIWVGKDGA